jgi:hypothetical protein
MLQEGNLGKKIVVGLDFDGVVAYSPIRLVRAPIKWLKREVFGIRKLTFFTPKYTWQKWMWRLVFESSMFPANGVELLEKMADDNHYEFHLITGRFYFMKTDLYTWLNKYNLKNVFTSINLNEHGMQPHLFKESMIKKLAIQYYVEDNLDVVLHLTPRVKSKVFWIYNFMDARHAYRFKYPYLKAALEQITD